MASGVKRLENGFERKITTSEKNRGYLFITVDKIIRQQQNFDVFINSSKIGNFVIDNCGRILIGRQVLRSLGLKVSVILKNGSLYITS